MFVAKTPVRALAALATSPSRIFRMVSLFSFGVRKRLSISTLMG